MQIDMGTSIGIIGIIIGIFVSFYFYRKSEKRKELYWGVRSNNLIQGYSTKLQGLIVIFKGNKIKNLTVSRMIFWNAGRDTIDKNDIQTINPVRIVASTDVKIISIRILACNNSSSQFEVELDKDGSNARFHFDYIDQGQGVVLQVVHTGTSSRDIFLAGDIKGVKKLVNKFEAPKWVLLVQKFKSKINIRPRTMMITAIFYGMIIIIYGILKIGLPIDDFNPDPLVNSNISDIFILTTNVFSGFLLALMGVSGLKLTITPKGLETYYEEWFETSSTY